MMPSTIASWVRTPGFGNELVYVNANRKLTNATPYVWRCDLSKENWPRTQTETGATARQKPTSK